MTATTPGLGAFFNPRNGDDQMGNYSRNPYDPLTLNDWLASVLPGDAKSYWINQPQLLIDPVGPDGHGNLRMECYVHIAAALRSSDHSALLVRENTYRTPAGNFEEWNMYSWDVSRNGTVSPVYLRVGETINAILITADMFAWADGSFQYSQLWSMPKSNMYPPFAGSYYTQWGFTHADGSPAGSLVPAVSYVNSTVTYLVGAWNPGTATANKLSVWTIDTQDPLAPTFQQQTVPVDDFSVPPDAQQKGTDVLITTWDASITNAVLQPNGLWLAQGVGGRVAGDTADRSCVRWYQLDPGGSQVLQQETLGDLGAHLYHPSIAANANGDMTLAFNESSDSSYAGLYYLTHGAADPPNTSRTSVLVHGGAGCFVRLEQPIALNPLGSRTAAALDLSDWRSIWVFGTYPADATADGRNNVWGTWLAQVPW